MQAVMKSLPNILTGSRLVMALFMFVALAASTGAVPYFADRLEPGERCASTSNRNFEGRQGAGGRTHLVSPAMAAAAALNGHFVDVRRMS